MNKYDIHLSTGTTLTVESVVTMESIIDTLVEVSRAYDGYTLGPYVHFADNENVIVGIIEAKHIVAVVPRTEPAPVDSKMIMDRDGDVWVEVGPDNYYMLDGRPTRSPGLPLADVNEDHGPTKPYPNDSLTS